MMKCDNLSAKRSDRNTQDIVFFLKTTAIFFRFSFKLEFGCLH